MPAPERSRLTWRKAAGNEFASPTMAKECRRKTLEPVLAGMRRVNCTNLRTCSRSRPLASAARRFRRSRRSPVWSWKPRPMVPPAQRSKSPEESSSRSENTLFRAEPKSQSKICFSMSRRGGSFCVPNPTSLARSQPTALTMRWHFRKSTLY